MVSPTQWTWVWVDSGSWWWEAWCAAVHGVTKSWTRLSNWTDWLMPTFRLAGEGKMRRCEMDRQLLRGVVSDLCGVCGLSCYISQLFYFKSFWHFSYSGLKHVLSLHIFPWVIINKSWVVKSLALGKANSSFFKQGNGMVSLLNNCFHWRFWHMHLMYNEEHYKNLLLGSL